MGAQSGSTWVLGAGSRPSPRVPRCPGCRHGAERAGATGLRGERARAGPARHRAGGDGTPGWGRGQGRGLPPGAPRAGAERDGESPRSWRGDGGGGQTPHPLPAPHVPILHPAPPAHPPILHPQPPSCTQHPQPPSCTCIPPPRARTPAPLPPRPPPLPAPPAQPCLPAGPCWGGRAPTLRPPHPAPPAPPGVPVPVAVLPRGGGRLRPPAGPARCCRGGGAGRDVPGWAAPAARQPPTPPAGNGLRLESSRNKLQLRCQRQQQPRPWLMQRLP